MIRMFTLLFIFRFILNEIENQQKELRRIKIKYADDTIVFADKLKNLQKHQHHSNQDALNLDDKKIKVMMN